MAQNKSSKLLLRSERNLVRDILLLLSNTYYYTSGKKNANRKCLGISTHFASSALYSLLSILNFERGIICQTLLPKLKSLLLAYCQKMFKEL